MAITDNLIAYWKMDESSGNMVDTVGSNTGTVTGVTYGASGVINDAYSFDGNDYVVATNATTFNPSSTNWTIALWAKITTNSTTKADENTFIAIQDGTGTGRNIFYTSENDNTLSTFLDGSEESCGTTLTTTDGWAHIVIQYDGTYYIFYKNGSLLCDNISASPSSCNGDFVLGAHKTTTQQWLNGDMDEVGIWTRVLTSTEISTLYNSGSGLAYPFTVSGTNMKINIGDSWKEIPSIKINVGDAWKEIASSKLNIADSWKEVF